MNTTVQSNVQYRSAVEPGGYCTVYCTLFYLGFHAHIFWVNKFKADGVQRLVIYVKANKQKNTLGVLADKSQQNKLSDTHNMHSLPVKQQTALLVDHGP